MGVAGERQRAVLAGSGRAGRAVAVERAGGAADRRVARRVVEAGGGGVELRGSSQTCCGFDVVADAGDVGAVAVGQSSSAGRLGGGARERRDHRGRLEPRPASSTSRSRRTSRGELGVDADQPRAGEPRVAVGDAERQPGDRLGVDREAAGAHREVAMVGVEPERLPVAVGIGDAQQPLAAEVEQQPVAGMRSRGMREAVHA